MRLPRLASVLAAVLLSAAPAVGRDGPAGPRLRVADALTVDSARDEMRVGRNWHASRILRGVGAHASDDPELLLLLARAEAGWRNWGEVGRLLEGRPWLASREGGTGMLLLGRAREEGGRWREAEEAYDGFLQAPAATGALRSATLARLARAAVAAGDLGRGLEALDALAQDEGALRGWAALAAAEGRAGEGDTTAVSALLARVTEPAALDRGWRVMPRARLAAGDTVAAEEAFRAAAVGAAESRRAQAAAEAGLLMLARGDSAGARSLLEEGFRAGPLASRGRAAAGLLGLGGSDPATTLGLADVLDRAGDQAGALRAYDRAAREAGGPPSLPEAARLARARLMATVRARQEEALGEFRAIRASTQDPGIGAENLEVWAGLRRRQDRAAEVATLRRWLLDDYPASPQAAEVLWEQGSAAEGRGEAARALELYATLAANTPGHARAGQARMRSGQIQWGRGRVAEAARVYESYLADFPSGRRWEEASYWAARAKLELGDTAAARALVARVRSEEPVSYYAVMGAGLLGEPYDVQVPEGEEAASLPWLDQGLALLDLMVEAGLAEAAEVEEARLVERARAEAPALMTLAEALIERGRTVTGINLGWDLRREGAAWDRRLLRVVYPFPYREMVIREAREWGLDPIVLAALIRQESAFKADIRSHAGAVGLMQVMPPTGEELARRHGPDGFTERSLEAPEVNLHLGAVFFRDMSRRYDEVLPLVLSAYNAGPTRATRWRRYPEASDPERFTERIPFEETRGYVKNVRRNLGLYQVLYGAD